ncbi:hypothetical protein HPP92_015797 [Vanilla planifolia]|uniref:Pru domain-containing protein n=1 Tax=Vanilla planifolia TaxID=51239 RepID=A0A835QPC1_VANPL|nr:hypothetical protein HPP92_015797 [Vanilla planifolia]
MNVAEGYRQGLHVRVSSTSICSHVLPDSLSSFLALLLVKFAFSFMVDWVDLVFLVLIVHQEGNGLAKMVGKECDWICLKKINENVLVKFGGFVDSYFDAFILNTFSDLLPFLFHGIMLHLLERDYALWLSSKGILKNIQSILDKGEGIWFSFQILRPLHGNYVRKRTGRPLYSGDKDGSAFEDISEPIEAVGEEVFEIHANVIFGTIARKKKGFERTSSKANCKEENAQSGDNDPMKSEPNLLYLMLIESGSGSMGSPTMEVLAPLQDVMLEFRAGKMFLDGTRVIPDTRKGLVQIGRVAQSSGRVYILKFNSDNRKFFFWMQGQNLMEMLQIYNSVNSHQSSSRVSGVLMNDGFTQSPPFQQQVDSFSHVLRTGQLDLSQFGVNPSKYKFTVLSFLEALEDTVARSLESDG